MLWSLFQAILPVALLLPLCVLLEQRSPEERYSLKSRLPGAFYLVLMPAALILVSWPLSKAWSLIGIKPLVSLAGLHPVLVCAAVLIFHDFLRYWEHRFEHRFWWPVHSVHHSITDLHSANSYGHPLMAIPEALFVSIPLSLIDMGGVAIPTALYVLIALQNIIIHSPIRIHLGPLRSLVVDNRFHRIHHSTDSRHFDRNFAITFSIWDRLFGTAYSPRENEWPETGIAEYPQPSAVGDYLLAPVNMLRRRPAEPRLIPVED